MVASNTANNLNVQGKEAELGHHWREQAVQQAGLKDFYYKQSRQHGFGHFAAWSNLLT